MAPLSENMIRYKDLQKEQIKGAKAHSGHVKAPRIYFLGVLLTASSLSPHTNLFAGGRKLGAVKTLAGGGGQLESLGVVVVEGLLTRGRALAAQTRQVLLTTKDWRRGAL